MVDVNSQHLYNRIGFGQPLSGMNYSKDMTVMAFQSLVKPTKIDVIARPSLADLAKGEKSRSLIERLIKRSVSDTVLLNHTWLNRMINPEEMLQEKMSLFWHDHFACRSPFAFLLQQQNNTIRTHALGSFRVLLSAVAKDPAMLQFLNNQQNKKGHPNENFARELLELFTIGRGEYNEDDIQNAARAFTGWGFNPLNAEFVFRSRFHDYGEKNFRGRQGKFNGDDILHMLLEDRKTAEFIVKKLWYYLVSTSEINKDIILELADSFYRSDYNIRELLFRIIDAPWFYDNKYRSQRIKSPVELLAGIQVHTNAQIDDRWGTAYIQRALGQILFYPPNVGGWPSDREWIDSSSLINRINLPAALIEGSGIDLNTNDDGDVRRLLGDVDAVTIRLNVDWERLYKIFSEASGQMMNNVESYLLATPTTDHNRKMISRYTDNATSNGEFMKRLYIGFMSTPEYQLC